MVSREQFSSISYPIQSLSLLSSWVTVYCTYPPNTDSDPQTIFQIQKLEVSTEKMLLSLLISLVMIPTSSVAYVPQSPHPTDWFEAELTLRNFPPSPCPTLSPARVATACLRSLQFADYPKEGAGFERVFPFLTWQFLRSVTCKDSIDCESFVKYAPLSPTLQPLFGATRIEIQEEECTIIAATQNRGEIRTLPVTVYGAEVLAFQHKSGMMKNSISSTPPASSLIIRLEQERRPPLSGCWLITDIVNPRYAKGGLGWSRHEGV
jgi:hypothetical protein